MKPIIKKVLRIVVLLVVTLVVIAYVFMTKWNAALNKRFYVGMKSTMMTLVASEDAYFAAHKEFAADPAKLDSIYRRSGDYTVAISTADSAHWTASVGSSALVGTCTVTGTPWTGAGKRPEASMASLVNSATCTDPDTDKYWHR